ncbi:malate dehydrogenase (oxaloacetate-decarboxylating) [Carnobacterium iners]|uniref:Malate dehydrogenase (Oxaloacetate-decarboxylating) n=1 Tax=Carnobacterium iners TaxID=1073423 RepID=A0A1X7NB34_9LACT|nr:malic enzyme-like NAD(P)-binding protein [Carnobacterium iners]SEL08143.1 malate dehydrogenase (oxaloacetate-decarboxylating) [Carnobacterium iners]SMH34030.1 malate dehydrogenase (oxaloacetate-decarboxylating) [Carnobacterium iners]
MDNKKEALDKHYEWNGKIEVISRVPINTREDLALAYTPGVAEACLAIEKEPDKAYDLTRKNNLVAVITNGTAVLGLGGIGPAAAMPVMEGKCILFKEFADVDAFPILIKAKDCDTIVQTIEQISGSFGGINLEDIAAPECFEVERRLKASLDIPVFHDDQHGTAIVVVAGLINALKLLNKTFETSKVVVNGAGSAGIAVAKHLLNFGVKNLILTDKSGILTSNTPNLNTEQQHMTTVTNLTNQHGDLTAALTDADIFVGVSAANILTSEMIQMMNPDPVVFAMANPVPEIMPDLAIEAGVGVIGTGRSDFPNQVNNVLAFPGVFKGALNVRASDINEAMKVAASNAIAALVSTDELKADYVIPDALDPRVCPAVTEAVKAAAIKSGVNRI